MHGAGDDWLNTELVDGKVWVQPKSCISACSNGATGNFTHAPTTLTSLHAVHMWVFPVQRCIAAAVRACVALQQAFQCTVSCIWLLSEHDQTCSHENLLSAEMPVFEMFVCDFAQCLAAYACAAACKHSCKQFANSAWLHTYSTELVTIELQSWMQMVSMRCHLSF